MKSPTVPIANPHDVGRGETLTVSPIDSFVNRQERWCANCGGLQLFIEVFEFAAGRAGFCFGCGDEKVIPFSHTTEAA